MPQTLDRIPSEKLVELVVRSVYEGDSNRPGGTKVQGISNLQIGTPPGGWSCNAVIDGADGQQILNVVYDGQQYSDTVQGAGADEAETEEAIAVETTDAVDDGSIYLDWPDIPPYLRSLAEELSSRGPRGYWLSPLGESMAEELAFRALGAFDD